MENTSVLTPETDVLQQSKLGIASFVAGVVNAVVFFSLLIAAFIIAGISVEESTYEDSEAPTAFVVVFVFIIAGIIPILVGAGLGVASLLQHGRRRGYTIAGLITNALVFAAWFAGFLLTVVAAVAG